MKKLGKVTKFVDPRPINKSAAHEKQPKFVPPPPPPRNVCKYNTYTYVNTT